MLMFQKYALAGLSVSFLLGGCTTVDYTRPEAGMKPPQKWVSSISQEKSYNANGWVKEFNHPRLEKLIDEVYTHNHDIEVAAANLFKASAMAAKASATLSPSLDLTSNISRQKNMDMRNISYNQYGVSLDVSWEVDIWGRLRSSQRAAVYDYYAVEYDLKSAMQSLSAQTAKSYFAVLETNRLLDLSYTFEQNLMQTLRVTEAFYEEGLLSKQDIHLIGHDLARARESTQNAKSNHMNALRTLEILLGRYPSADFEAKEDFPAMPAHVKAGIPSDVLEHRPDIRAAERRVASAFNRLEEAKAAKLPTISLTGSFGARSDELEKLSDPLNVLWNIGGGILFPIFNAGKLDAEVDIKSAEQKAAIANYQKTAFKAFKEVETALSNEILFRKRQQYIEEALENAQLAEKIANENFSAGEITLLDLLQIKRSTLQTQIERVSAQRQLLEQYVNLHLALGGDS
ncbi:MAG: efflux transporter outer membrane subunit [Sulfurimonas sp.]|nr:efflux transporter outer membrane subunit [Sulfurimonas sp.]MDD5202773.1 efflux transporter outer membrane subunit [Sulfurimonas sp.]